MMSFLRNKHVATLPAPWSKRDRAVRWFFVAEHAFDTGVVDEATTVVAVMDFDGLGETVGRLRRAFPDWWRHRFAVKANPLTAVIGELSALGLEMEAASAGEIAACTAAGVSGTCISYNSPVKTVQEIQTCLEAGIALSIDNEQEFRRVANMRGACTGRKKSLVGFRINPQVGGGDISLTSTAHSSSKFGFPIQDSGARELLIKHYLDNTWLNYLHVHTGSQGVALDRMVEGIVIVKDLALQINNQAGRRAVERINIGGGLPVHCDPGCNNISFPDYADALTASATALFSGEFGVETEFGRSIVAENGILITRVEYTKSAGGRHIAAVHAGSQVAVRTALSPENWPLHVTVLDSRGQPKMGDLINTDLAGPCCFGGDLLCTDQPLVNTAPGDFVLVHNAGAYTFTSHYDFNLIPRIAVYKVDGGGEHTNMRCIRSAQDIKTICNQL